MLSIILNVSRDFPWTRRKRVGRFGFGNQRSMGHGQVGVLSQQRSDFLFWNTAVSCPYFRKLTCILKMRVSWDVVLRRLINSYRASKAHSRFVHSARQLKKAASHPRRRDSFGNRCENFKSRIICTNCVKYKVTASRVCLFFSLKN